MVIILPRSPTEFSRKYFYEVLLNAYTNSTQTPFDNESIIPIVVENCFYEVYRTRTSSTKFVVIRISTLSVLKSLCPAGAHLGCAVLQGLERMLTLCVHNAMILRVPKG